MSRVSVVDDREKTAAEGGKSLNILPNIQIDIWFHDENICVYVEYKQRMYDLGEKYGEKSVLIA